MKSLDIQDGIRSTVYAILVAQLKTDPGLKAIVDPDGWNTYIDEDSNDAPPGEDTLPSLEMLPFGSGANPASIVMQEAPMGVSINIACDGTDVRDLLNLWELVEAALFKGDGQATLLHKLKAALAALERPGQVASINLTAPAITTGQAALDKQILVAAGSILVQLRIPK